jgi:hypothetical protein
MRFRWKSEGRAETFLPRLADKSPQRADQFWAFFRAQLDLACETRRGRSGSLRQSERLVCATSRSFACYPNKQLHHKHLPTWNRGRSSTGEER